MTSLDPAIAASLGELAQADPRRFLRVVGGMALDGTLARSGLAPFMALPPAEAKRLTRARMAELILNRYSADGRVTRDDLEGGGFTAAEIAEHYRDALRISGVMQAAA